MTFRAYRVRFAVKLLNEKIKLSSNRLVGSQNILKAVKMRTQANELLVDSDSVGEYRALGKYTVFVKGYIVVGKYLAELCFKPLLVELGVGN